MAFDNFGIIVKKGATTIGSDVVVDFPEVTVTESNVTHHASTMAEYLPAGVPDFGTFTVKMLVTSPTLSGIMNDLLNKTISTYTIEFPDDTGVVDSSGQAFITSIKPESADAQSAEGLMVTVVFRTTGAWTGNFA